MTLLTLFLACSANTQSDGTIVGNPGSSQGKLAEGSNIEVYSAFGEMQTISYMSGEAEDTVFVETELDLIEIDDGFSLETGRWDQVEVHFSEIIVQGDVEGSGFIAVLSDVFLPLQANNLVLNQQSYVLELGRPGWITPDNFEGLQPNEDGELVIEPDSEVLEGLQEALHYESSLFIDTDGDQQLSENERDNVVASTNEEVIPEPEEPEPDSDESESGSTSARVGCQETQLSLLLLPLLFLKRRQR